MKKLILAIFFAFLSVGAYAKSPKVQNTSIDYNFRPVSFNVVGLKSKCGVAWSGTIHYESSFWPNIEHMNFIDRMLEMIDAIDAACDTGNTTVYF